MNLAGSFRIGDRESRVLCYLRGPTKMSMNRIAELIGRSVSTVHYHVKEIPLDNREGISPRGRSIGVRVFQGKKRLLRLQVRMYLMGLFDTMKEAVSCETVPIAILETENTLGEDGEDPS